MKKKISYFFASMFGFGFFPFASGTVGSLATLPIGFVLVYYYGFWGVLSACILVYFFGVLSAKEVLKYTKHDPSLIVIDETIGQLLSFLFVAPYLYQKWDCQTIILYVCGFILFRLFDITKPSLIGWADRKIENAHGVMLDDVFAGIFAGLSLLMINFVI